MDLVSQFDTIVAALDAAGVEHAICGGFAVNIHGHVRATMKRLAGRHQDLADLEQLGLERQDGSDR